MAQYFTFTTFCGKVSLPIGSFGYYIEDNTITIYLVGYDKTFQVVGETPSDFINRLNLIL